MDPQCVRWVMSWTDPEFCNRPGSGFALGFGEIELLYVPPSLGSLPLFRVDVILKY